MSLPQPVQELQIGGTSAAAQSSGRLLQGRVEFSSREPRMGNDAVVAEELAQKFATEKDSPYTRWVRREGLDIIGAHHVPNLRTVELKAWPRRGGRGVFINHEASRTSNDCYVCEIGDMVRADDVEAFA